MEFTEVNGVAVTHALNRWGGAEVLRITSGALEGRSAEFLKFCSGDTVSYTFIDAMPEDAEGEEEDEVEPDRRKVGTFIDGASMKIKLLLYGMTSDLEYDVPVPGSAFFDSGFITMGEASIPSIPTEAFNAGVSAVRHGGVKTPSWLRPRTLISSLTRPRFTYRTRRS